MFFTYLNDLENVPVYHSVVRYRFIQFIRIERVSGRRYDLIGKMSRDLAVPTIE